MCNQSIIFCLLIPYIGILFSLIHIRFRTYRIESFHLHIMVYINEFSFIKKKRQQIQIELNRRYRELDCISQVQREDSTRKYAQSRRVLSV